MQLVDRSELKSIDNPYTKTFVYALPMLRSHKSKFVNIKNCFLRNVDYPDYEEHLFPVFLDQDKDSYNRMIEEFRGDMNYKFDYMFDEVHRSFCFSIPGQYKDDFKYFKESKYSRFSDPYKSRIIHFYDLNMKGKIPKMLYRDEEKYKEREIELNVSIPRENEIISALNPYKETLTHDLKVNYEYTKSS